MKPDNERQLISVVEKFAQYCHAHRNKNFLNANQFGHFVAAVYDDCQLQEEKDQFKMNKFI